MRNGNNVRPTWYGEIEITGSYPTYEEWKLKSLIYVLFCVQVLILPMRNGNNVDTPNSLACSNSSYPTYEEWKH